VRASPQEPWSVFARSLSVSLAIAFLVLVISVGIDVYRVTGERDGGAAELLLWETGSRGDGSAEGAETDHSSLGAIALFALIPIVTYAGTVVSYARHHRTAYVVIGMVQLVILLGVALPVLWSLLPAIVR